MALRLAFMGTPDFAVPALRSLIAAGHEVVAVYSQPPRPAGRGHKLTPSPIHRLAEEHGIEVRTPASLKGEDARTAFRALGLDAAVVVAYGLILPGPILDAPRRGCVNLHASLLPRWRGAAPIQRAILEGDTETGVTVMLMDEGLDTGPMLATVRIPIGPRTSAPELAEKLAQAGATLLPETLDAWCAGRIEPMPQPDGGVTYAAKISRADAVVDWTAPAPRFDAQVRALTPWPGVSVEIAGERVKVLACEPVDGSGDPGYVIDRRLTVACGRGAVRLTRLQRPNRRPVDAAGFLAATPVPPGTRLGS